MPNGRTAFALTVVALAATVLGADRPIGGTKLTLKRSSSGAEKLVFVSSLFECCSLSCTGGTCDVCGSSGAACVADDDCCSGSCNAAGLNFACGP